MEQTEMPAVKRADADRLLQVIDALGQVQLDLDHERIHRLAVQALFDEIVAAMSEAVLIADPRGRVTEANDAAFGLLGLDRPEVIGMPVQQVLGPVPFSSPWQILDSDPQGHAKTEISLTTKSGSARVSLSSAVVRDSHGKIVGTVFVARDLSETEQLLYSLEHAQHRLTFVAEAGVALASSLDVETSFGLLARMAVPAIADAFVVCFRADGGDRVVAEHVDVEAVGALRRELLPQHLALESPSAKLHTRLTGTESDPIVRALHTTGMASAIVAPMTMHAEPLGAMALAVGPDRDPYKDADRRLVEDLADRAALSMANARRYSEQLHVARVLQRSLLPRTLPDVEGFDLAATYQPGAEGLTVGGDFYDIFETHSGLLAVLGDVCGKGVEAATLTALTRYTVRAATLKLRQPRQILELLNDAILAADNDGRFCTVVLARLQHTSRGVRMTVATGGHPPPIVIRSNGEVQPLELQGTLLGIFEAPELAERRILLQEGDAVVFYTDGVTEAPTAQGQFGEEAMLDALRSVKRGTADDTVTTLSDAVAASRVGAPDDLAVVAVRVTG